MPGHHSPDAPPPEVPEEFADAYRHAYRRALEDESRPGAELGQQRTRPSGPAEARRQHMAHGWRSERWFVPAVVGVSALVLVAAAYAVGLSLAGDDAPGTATPSAQRTDHPGRSDSPHDRPSRSRASTAPGGWAGPVAPVPIDAVSADCTARPSNDSVGRKVTYDPENAIDGRIRTAWRCSGTALGQTLTLRLSEDSDIAQVGLIPGYAKTDPASGVDRYAENNRIIRVRWTLGDGVRVVQRLDPDPTSREVQLIRVPRTTTDTVSLEILAIDRGARNTTAISEVVLAAAD